MAAIIHFKCPGCEAEIRFDVATAAAGGPLPRLQKRCPSCGADVTVHPDHTLLGQLKVRRCAVCGHENFYIQKDFNRNLGLLIVGAGILVSVYFLGQREPLYAMAVLGLSALSDLLLYYCVGDVTVCYSCHAIYRGFARNPEHEAFDLKKLEKYGGRDSRFRA